MAQVLKPEGTAGIIVSNRFMTTKSGSSVRHALLERCDVVHVWDLGDTKLFDAAVLPAVLLVRGGQNTDAETGFTSIYKVSEPANANAANVIEALSEEGIVEITDGRAFRVMHGTLNTSGRG